MNRRQAKKILRRCEPDLLIRAAFGNKLDGLAPPMRGWAQALAKWNRDIFTVARGWGRWNPLLPTMRAVDHERHVAWIEKIKALVEAHKSKETSQ